jgi:two-component system, NtrC family, response regulator HydG
MARSTGNILLADDDEFVLLSLKVLLAPHFNSVLTTNNPERIPALLGKDQYDVVVLDMNFRRGDTTGNQGLFWLRKILALSPDTQIILLTAYADVHVAVESIREGALDFIVKPWQNEKLLATVKAANTLSQEKRKFKHLKTQQKTIVSALEPPYEPLLGESESVQEIRRIIAKVAPTEAEVLILGPNGTGKEVIAREIHQQSKRADAVFMAVDVGTLTESIFESELFGHRKGAFTDAKDDRIGRFEAAAGGTLLLDEIGNLSLSLQSKLLTVLQHKRVIRVGTNEPIDVDVRILCATNANLTAMVKDGRFREDLLYRINTVEINVPSLSERQADIPIVAEYFLKKLATKYHKPGLHFSNDAIAWLKKYTWPGNVRELKHTVERAVILCDGTILNPGDFSSAGKQPGEDLSFDNLNLEKLEEWAIRKALAKYEGNVSHAAEELGLSRGALYRRIEQYGI